MHLKLLRQCSLLQTLQPSNHLFLMRRRKPQLGCKPSRRPLHQLRSLWLARPRWQMDRMTLLLLVQLWGQQLPLLPILAAQMPSPRSLREQLAASLTAVLYICKRRPAPVFVGLPL